MNERLEIPGLLHPDDLASSRRRRRPRSRHSSRRRSWQDEQQQQESTAGEHQENHLVSLIRKSHRQLYGEHTTTTTAAAATPAPRSCRDEGGGGAALAPPHLGPRQQPEWPPCFHPAAGNHRQLAGGRDELFCPPEVQVTSPETEEILGQLYCGGNDVVEQRVWLTGERQGLECGRGDCEVQKGMWHGLESGCGVAEGRTWQDLECGRVGMAEEGVWQGMDYGKGDSGSVADGAWQGVGCGSKNMADKVMWPGQKCDENDGCCVAQERVQRWLEQGKDDVKKMWLSQGCRDVEDESEWHKNRTSTENYSHLQQTNKLQSTRLRLNTPSLTPPPERVETTGVGGHDFLPRSHGHLHTTQQHDPMTGTARSPSTTQDLQARQMLPSAYTLRTPATSSLTWGCGDRAPPSRSRLQNFAFSPKLFHQSGAAWRGGGGVGSGGMQLVAVRHLESEMVLEPRPGWPQHYPAGNHQPAAPRRQASRVSNYVLQPPANDLELPQPPLTAQDLLNLYSHS